MMNQYQSKMSRGETQYRASYYCGFQNRSILKQITPELMYWSWHSKRDKIVYIFKYNSQLQISCNFIIEKSRIVQITIILQLANEEKNRGSASLALLWGNSISELMTGLINHLTLDKMATISQTVFSAAFSWMKRFVFWLKFHWSLFPRIQLITTQHCFRYWLGA